jgi:flagellar FliL protein
MSDAQDDEVLESGDGADGGDAEGGGKGKKKKKGRGIGALLPTILKFAGIGLALVALIVTVSIITYSLLSKGGKQQTAIPTTESYLGKKPQYQMFTLIGPISTRTNDSTPYTVQVDMILGYDMNDNATGSELTVRQYELRDFMRRYFNGKSARELRPENEERIKQEIRETLNTQMLDKARVRIILFNRLDVMETS